MCNFLDLELAWRHCASRHQRDEELMDADIP
jgi:hypothetical protein